MNSPWHPASHIPLHNIWYLYCHTGTTITIPVPTLPYRCQHHHTGTSIHHTGTNITIPVPTLPYCIIIPVPAFTILVPTSPYRYQHHHTSTSSTILVPICGSAAYTNHKPIKVINRQ